MEIEGRTATAMRAAKVFRAFPWPIEEAQALEVAGDVDAALESTAASERPVPRAD